MSSDHINHSISFLPPFSTEKNKPGLNLAEGKWTVRAFCRGKPTWWFSLGHMNNFNSFPRQKANREQANPKPYLSHGILTLTSQKLHTPQKTRFFLTARAMGSGVHRGNSGGKNNDYFSTLWKNSWLQRTWKCFCGEMSCVPPCKNYDIKHLMWMNQWNLKRNFVHIHSSATIPGSSHSCKMICFFMPLETTWEFS